MMDNYWEDDTPPEVVKDINKWLEEKDKED